jgi:hypothetical protein
MRSRRALISLFTAISFAAVAITGVVTFFTPYGERLSALHVAGGFAFLVAAALHVTNNWRPIVKYLAARRLATALGATALVLGAAWYRWPPVGGALRWGEHRRQPADRVSYQTIRVQGSGGVELTLDVKRGAAFHFVEPTHGWGIIPQMAIWIEDIEGHYLQTLYVTQSEGKDDYLLDDNKQVVRRPEALPHWSHKRGVRAEDGLFSPSRTQPLPDAISSATPTSDFYLVGRAPAGIDRFVVKVEVNNSFDYNEYYNRNAFPDDPIYMGSGNPAQPSLIYAAIIDVRAGERVSLMRPVGHGHHSGADGNLYPDLSKLTTALEILDRVVVEWRYSGSEKA